MKLNVLLVDGRKLFREGLCALLEKHPDVKVVGEADDAATAPKLVRALQPDVVILNLPLSTRDAANAVRTICTAGSPAGTRVVLLTVHTDPAFFREILQAGAAGCLTKESASEDLMTSIRTVMAGRIYLSPAIAEAVVTGYVIPKSKRAARQLLSSREREILQRVADGETTKQIAARLGVSSKTIETYRRRVMEKLRLRSVAELTKYAVREGLTSLELQA
jgi:DNA-binding NarL/FixJ family response regulator